MKVFVAGAVAGGGAEEIRELQEFLRKSGFEVVNQLEIDYSNVEDFRDKAELVREIVESDLRMCEEADVVVLVASKPSFGAMAEAVVSSIKGKPVITFAPEKLPSPWPIYFSQTVVKSKSELVEVLKSIEKMRIRTVANIYGEHEAEFVYDKFTCICPVTGRRDYAKVIIRYVPRDRLLEYESLERYFEWFKDKAMHHEAVAEKILRDLKSVLNPKRIEVVCEFEERSNVKAKIRRVWE